MNILEDLHNFFLIQEALQREAFDHVEYFYDQECIDDEYNSEEEDEHGFM